MESCPKEERGKRAGGQEEREEWRREMTTKSVSLGHHSSTVVDIARLSLKDTEDTYGHVLKERQGQLPCRT